MPAARVAFDNLLYLARADGRLDRRELEVLRRYGAGLEIPAAEVEARLRRPPPRLLACPSAVVDEDGERTHVMKMLVRVAMSDGRLTRREAKFLRRVADSLGIGRIRFADIVVAIQQETATAQGASRGVRYAAIGVLAVGLLAVVVGLVRWELTGRSRAQTEAMAALQASFADREEELRRRGREAIDAAERERHRAEEALARRIELLEARAEPAAGAPAPAAATDVAAELAALRTELARLRDARQTFQALAERCSPAVLLLFVRIELGRGRERQQRWSSGTGFFVSRAGHIVTNKHVIAPWLFDADLAELADEGWEVAVDRVLLCAWPGGVEFRNAGGALDLDAGFSTARGTLEVWRQAPAEFEHVARKRRSGRPYHGRYHKDGVHDLAILLAKTAAPAPVLELRGAGDEPVRKLDAVMALGFPGQLNGSRRAETAPSLGEVRKVDELLFITAPIVGGNSGGPVLDMRGRVVGVSTATFGDATVGACVPASYVAQLLGRR